MAQEQPRRRLIAPDDPAFAAELAELEASVRKWRGRAEAEEARTARLVDAVAKAAREAYLTHAQPLPKPPKQSKQSKGKERELVALLHLTDWQTGKRTTSYDTDVLRRRMGLCTDKVFAITESQRAAHLVRRCVLLWGGDMVENVATFPQQAWQVDSTLFDQVFAFAAIGEVVMRDLLCTFDEVEVWCEWGNHGRLGRKGDYPTTDNADRFGYRVLAERFADEPRVAWHQSTPDWYQMVTIGEYRAMLAHGDEIRSFGGNVPAYGILRKANAWASGVVEPFDDIYLGHFHSVMTLPMANGGRVFVTGSPESDNPYAKEFVAATGHPSQRLHFVDPKKGRVTSEHILYLDEVT